MTIEGELDDISAPGQTVVAHKLCPNIPAPRREHRLQPGVGHYGIFNGRRWRDEIMPAIAEFIRKQG
jgi:poly(3-hydroxybutyrate) depolymerase